MKENDDRLEIIETKLAFLEDFMSQLQEVTVEHEKTIQKLQKENKELKKRMIEVSENFEGDIPNRKPPHY